MERVVSMAIVRHPFGRLVSAYYSKMIDLGHKAWSNVRRHIIMQFRFKADKTSQAFKVWTDQVDYDFNDDGTSNPSGRIRESEFVEDDPSNARLISVLSNYY